MASTGAALPAPPSWTAPSWERFSWARDCGLYSDYMTVVAPGGDDIYAKAAVSRDYSSRILHSYVQSALPANYTPVPSVDQVLQWHLFYAGSEDRTGQPPDLVPLGFRYAHNESLPRNSHGLPWFVSYTVSQTSASCVAQSCDALQRSSFLDNDVAGIGVFSSYAIGASLVTIYVLFYLLEMLRRRLGRLAVPLRVANAFRGSSYDLYLAAVLLNLGLQLYVVQGYFVATPGAIAGIGTHGTAAYRVTLMRLASAFGVFPVLVLAPLAARGGRRRGLLVAAAAVSWLLFAVPIVIGTIMGYDAVGWRLKSGGQDTFSPFVFGDGTTWYRERYCGGTGLDFGTGPYLVVVVCAVAFLCVPPCWAVWMAATWCVSRCSRRRRGWSNAIGRLERVCSWANRCVAALLAVLGLVGMWTVLAVIAVIRRTVVDGGRASSGSPRPEDAWGFGQVVAVALWIPALVELVYILIFKMKRGLQGRLPGGCSVVYNKETKGAVRLLAEDEQRLRSRPASPPDMVPEDKSQISIWRPSRWSDGIV